MEQKKVQRLPAEQLFQKEIDALIAAEKDPIPTGWRMSPRSVPAAQRSRRNTSETSAWWRLPSRRW